MRIILILLLVIGVSFACDQPFDEVRGFKIGCPFEPQKGMLSNGEDEGIASYTIMDGHDVYMMKEVKVLGGDLVELSLSTSPDFSIKQEVLLDALMSSWGGNLDLTEETEEGKTGEIVLGEILQNKSQQLGNISFMLIKEGDDVFVAEITYTSNKLIDYKLALDNAESRDDVMRENPLQGL